MKIIPEQINPNAILVCQNLQNNGYQAYIVGGCVRDLLLNITPKDWDICTNARPDAVQELFEKTYPTGLQHGTVTVAMNEEHFEVTTYRVEGEYLDGRRPSEVEFVDHIQLDLARRDLTINAIAYDPIEHVLVDPFDGQGDLEGRLIRCVGSPQSRFNEDGLRIMRVARFAARFNYNIDSATKIAMTRCLDTLRKVSIERIADELKKTLMSAHPVVGLKLLDASGALAVACPELTSFYLGEVKYFYQIYTGDVETRLAVLYKDIPLDQVNKELLSLKLSTKEIKRVMFLLSLYREFMPPYGKGNPICNSDSFYIEMVARMKNDTPDTYEYTLKQFGHFLHGNLFLEKINSLTVWSRKELAINGNDLLAMGVTAGPQIKTILNAAYQFILKNPQANDPEQLKVFAKTMI